MSIRLTPFVKYTAAAATLLLSVNTWAQVTLMVDDNIKVTAINGKTIQQSMFQPLKRKFNLQPGTHVITAKYDRLFDLRRDEHDYLRSGNVSVSAQLDDNKTYYLTMPGQPSTYDKAKEYAKKPTLAVTLNGQTVASEQSSNNNEGGLLSGLTKSLGGIFSGGDEAQMQNQRAIAALNQNTSTAAAAPANINTVASQNTSTLDQFMQLWLKATPAEREKIRQWVAK